MSAILKQKLIDIANGFTKYGLWKGGGSGNLSELDDVTLTNLQTNDVLTYNGSKWVNDDNLQKQIDTLNSNLDQTIYCNHQYLDLNDFHIGLAGYFNNKAQNTPCQYGIVYNLGFDMWKFQIVFDTNGRIFMRKNINWSVWTDWQQV